MLVLISLREAGATSLLEKPCPGKGIFSPDIREIEQELSKLEEGWGTPPGPFLAEAKDVPISGHSIVVEIDDPLDFPRLPGEPDGINTVVIPHALGERRPSPTAPTVIETIVMPNRPMAIHRPQKSAKVYHIPGSLYEVERPDGTIKRIAISDQYLKGPELADPVLELKKSAEKLGRKVDPKPLLKKVPILDEKGLIIGEKEEQVAGGVRSIYYDPKTSAIYKHNLGTDFLFNLIMRVREKITTRYFNDAFKNAVEEFRMDIQALQHVYIHGDIGWSSQAPNKGMTLHQYRQSLKGAELDDFNSRLVLFNKKLLKENKAMSKLIDNRFEGAHLYKGVGEETINKGQMWLLRKNNNQFIQKVSEAFSLGGDRSHIIKNFSGSEVAALKKTMAKFDKLPLNFRLAMAELEDVEAELEMYKTFKRGHEDRIKFLAKIKNELEMKTATHRLMTDYRQLKGEIDSFIMPKISAKELNKEFAGWAAEHGYLADIDTGRIHFDTPHGQPNDLDNCRIIKVKIIKGKRVEVIRCHDIG